MTVGSLPCSTTTEGGGKMPYGPHIGTGVTVGGGSLVAMQYASYLMLVIAALFIIALSVSMARKSRRRTVDKRP